MQPVIRIAVRNVLKARRRSLLVALTIFISTLLLFISNFTMNGVETQVLKGYVNLQSGDVCLESPEVQLMDPNNPGKYIQLDKPDRDGPTDIPRGERPDARSRRRT